MTTRRSFLKETSLLTVAGLTSGLVTRQAAAQNAPTLGGATPNMATPATVKRGDMLYRTPVMTGKLELFKTANRYDGTAKNPQWLG